MPKPIKFSYEKKPPFRDSFYFIIVCEGQQREPGYFRFFDGLSSRVKVVPVQSQGSSAPRNLIDCAVSAEKELGADPSMDRLWFVIDTDQWRDQLHEIRKECNTRPHWQVAQSNPCFEVWLYFHAKQTLPILKNPDRCQEWKSLIPTIIKGGFNMDFHPVAIETAISNSKRNYAADGYHPQRGNTQLWQLGEELLPLIQKDLQVIKEKFPHPTVIS